MSRLERQIASGIPDLLAEPTSGDPDLLFRRLVVGKRVAVVGPAATLAGAGRGRLIESYDVVVRFNDALEHLPFAGALARDYGRRADVVYLNQVVIRDRILSGKGLSAEGLLRVCGAAGVRYLSCTNNSLAFAANGEPGPRCPPQDREVLRDLGRLIQAGGTGTRFRVVYAPSRALMQWMGGHFGRTGMVAILDLLSQGVGELYITGMTFYHGGGHLFPIGGASLHPLRNRDGSWARGVFRRGHDSQKELEIMRVLVRLYAETVRLDPSVEALLRGGAGRPTHVGSLAVGRLVDWWVRRWGDPS